MKMFLGQYNPNITEGSRIALPKKMREQIQESQVIMTRGFEKCIYVYDIKDWASEAQKQIENSKEQGKVRELERYIYTSAQEATVDTQGRLVIPQSLLSYAEVKEELSVIGVGDRIEIWSRDNWTEYNKKISAKLAEI